VTILFPQNFKQSPSAGFDGIFNWDFLFPAFAGTKIMPMDVDCLIERRGCFLGFETKDAGVPLRLGQRMAIEASVKAGWIYVFCRKRPDEIEEFEIWWPDKKYKGGIRVDKRKGSATDLVKFTKNWFERVNRGAIIPVIHRQFGSDLFDAMTPIETLCHIFEKLSPSDQATFIEWARP
jgi:hypothetical protein